MWIKVINDNHNPYDTHFNFDRVFKFKVTPFNKEYAVVAEGDGSSAMIAHFDTKHEARAFIDRLVNKLGRVIDANMAGAKEIVS